MGMLDTVSVDRSGGDDENRDHCHPLGRPDSTPIDKWILLLTVLTAHMLDLLATVLIVKVGLF